MWYDLIVRKITDDAGLYAEVKVPLASRWFEGHFPGKPVLPGVAQLNMVADLIRWARDESLVVKTVSRVRFKQMILPGDHLIVTAEPKSGRNDTYLFRILKNGQMVCGGAIAVTASTARQMTQEE